MKCKGLFLLLLITIKWVFLFGDDNGYHESDKIIDINKRKNYLNIMGTGSPTVIFISDIDCYGSLNWNVIEKNVSKKTRTVNYDRRGYNWSDRGKLPRTGEILSKELEEILIAINSEGPFIVVAHAMGSIYGRIFTGRNIEKIVGILFIDPVNPEQNERMKSIGYSKGIPNKNIRPIIWLIQTLGLTNRNRLKQYGFSNEDYEIARYFYNKNSLTWFDETVSSEQSLKEAKRYSDFGAIPLRILTSRKEQTNAKLLKEWIELQSQLMNLSSNSKQIIIEDSGHYLHIDRPEIVSNEIDKLIIYCRENGTD